MRCGEETWNCTTSSECVQLSWLCDGDLDCGDGSDEVPANCEDRTTSPSPPVSPSTDMQCNPRTEFSCGPAGGCIPHDRVCDHHNDCGNWEDEPETCHIHINECEVDNGREF